MSYMLPFRAVKGIFERLRAPRQTKAAGDFAYYWPTWRSGKPQWQIIDYHSYAKEGFTWNALIYEAIMYKAKAVIAAPLRAWTGDVDRPEPAPENNPLAQLLAKPNEHQSGPEMAQQAVVYLNISGNCYYVLVRNSSNVLPERIYCIRPDRMYIVPFKSEDGKRTVSVGYIYVPEGTNVFRAADPQERRRMLREGDAIPLPTEDVMHVKLPNPLDPLEGMGYGLSPIAPMAKSADVDNDVTDFLKQFFERGLMPNIAFTFKEPMAPGDVARVRERVKEIFGGYDRWIEPMILDNQGDVKQISQTFEEMGFEAIDERNESRILGPLGVPPILVGSRVGLKRATYSNYGEARTAFWQDTMIPESKLTEQEYRNYLSIGGAYPGYDYSQVPALQGLRDAYAMQIAEAFKAAAATRNEYRLALGLDEIKGQDVFLVPFNLSEVPAIRPAGFEVIEGQATEVPALPSGQEEEEQPQALETEPKKALPRQKRGFTADEKQRIWKVFDRQMTSRMRLFRSAGERAFRDNWERIQHIINSYKAVNWYTIEEEVRAYLLAESGDMWRAQFLPVMTGIIEAQGAMWATTLGMQFDVSNLLAQQWFNDYTLVFAQQINQTTLDTLAEVFQHAQAEGWSIPDMEERLDVLFHQWMYGDQTSADFEWYWERLPLWRRELIARTELLRSSNAGAFNLFKDWNVPMKEWLSTFDDRVRPAHAEAGGRYVEGGSPGPIPIDQPFVVGGEQMMYPGDPNADISNTANCRCTVAPYNPMWGTL